MAGCSDGGSGAGAPWFADEAAPRGLDFRHVSGFEGRHLMPEIVGGGAALADVDGDGDLDAYLVQSGSLHRPGSDQGRNRLYLNDGTGNFAFAADAGADDPGYGMGVAAGDYDNDGDVDFYVTNYGPNVLLRNDGAGRFENVTATAGVADPGWSTAAAFLDLDGDGDLDLMVVNYLNWSADREIECYSPNGFKTYCPPANYNAPARDRLYRNNGDGTFTDITEAAGVGTAFGNGLGALGADFDADGRTDLFVANDMMVNQLWVNRGDLKFADEAMFRGCGVDEHGTAKAGMGVAAGDVDDDGDADLLVVNLQGQTDSFFRNEGAWFEDATEEVGLGAVSGRYTRFGVVLADFDNDGRLDIYQANGRVDRGEGVLAENDEFAEPNVLYRGGANGRFVEVLPLGGTAAPLVRTSRGLAIGDVDDDGGLDLLVVNRDAAPYLLMNRAPNRGNWVRFRVRLASGRDAHGAMVAAEFGGKRLTRAVRPEGSYLASSDPRVHFGLGDTASVQDAKVLWPSGAAETFGGFEAGATHDLREGAGAPASW